MHAGSLTSDFLWSRWRGNVPCIPGVCATRDFTYLVRKRLMVTGRLNVPGPTYRILVPDTERWRYSGILEYHLPSGSVTDRMGKLKNRNVWAVRKCYSTRKRLSYWNHWWIRVDWDGRVGVSQFTPFLCFLVIQNYQNLGCLLNIVFIFGRCRLVPVKHECVWRDHMFLLRKVNERLFFS